MKITYFEAPDVKELVDEVIEKLDFSHILSKFVLCYRSKGSKSKRIIARIHGLGKIWQGALCHPTTYIIEVLSEQFDKLPIREKEKVIIHELLHIPKGFSGGFRPHKGYIHPKKIEKLYKLLRKKDQ